MTLDPLEVVFVKMKAHIRQLGWSNAVQAAHYERWQTPQAKVRDLLCGLMHTVRNGCRAQVHSRAAGGILGFLRYSGGGDTWVATPPTLPWA